VDFSELNARGEMRPGEARLPWDDATFSARMLAEHLDQRHDLASRRAAVIDGHVAWLRTLTADPGRALDLGCGPGLYLERLATVGWECVGVDVSPAAIDHARRRAHEGDLACQYVLGDFERAVVQGPFDLVLCLYGEISTIGIDATAAVLARIASLLGDGGRGVIECSTAAGVRAKGERGRSWYATDQGLFGDRMHVVLRDSQWFDTESASVERWWVIDGSDEPPRMYGSTTWAYGDRLSSALADAGLRVQARYGDLAGAPRAEGDEFEVIVVGTD